MRSLAGAQGAGVDPRAVISLTAATRALDPGASTSYTAGGQKDRRDGSGYGSDGEFLEALSNAEDQVREHLCEVKALQEQVVVALDCAQRDLEQARRDLEAARAALAAAYAMGTRDPCDGCHSARAAAIAAAEAAIAEAEARIRDAERRIAICEGVEDILDPLAVRLAQALVRLRTVPQDLGEVYELIYEFVRSGGRTAAVRTLDRRRERMMRECQLAVFGAARIPGGPPKCGRTSRPPARPAIEPGREIHLHLTVTPDRLAAIVRHHTEEDR